ncbi:MAG: hypothetical protein SFY66_17575 [Oculatellaceae cyanobacterium bins.114]|nr:hypothetical protein [Oculatellaceae cyanobacterium bins.114]
MVTVVVILNSLIGLACLYAAWRVWRLRQALATIADSLIAAERNTHRVLNNAPNAIIKGQLGVYQVRQQTQQLQKVQQILALVSSLGQLPTAQLPFWRQRPSSKRQKSGIQRKWQQR